MAFKFPFFSRLFGARPKEDGKKEDPPRSEEPSPAATPPPEKKTGPKPVQMELSPDHPIQSLWGLRCRQAGWLPTPVLRLEDAQGQPAIPESEARQELSRLQTVLTAAAGQRLALAQPKPAGRDEPPPPPPDMDAQAVVCVSANRMTAWLLVFPPVGGGEELSAAMLSKALADSQVRFGVDEELLERLPGDRERYFHLFLAARGQTAQNGKDGWVVDLFPRHPERKVTLNENNCVDYTELDFVQNVEEGAVICRIVPPTKGIPGRTVLDQPLSARDGRAATAPKGRNTQLSEDGSSLLASRTGHVEFNGRTFQVKPLLEIDGNVDYSTGSINFLGDVHIHGDICSGFTVRAMGNITVDGVVEACTVEAGGDLIVVKGVQGDNQAVLRAHRSMFTKYLENCCAYVKETLQTDCIMNCEVLCNGTVEVRSGRMTIIGSTIRAGHEVTAGVLGSRAEGLTSIYLGGQPCEDYDYDVLIREIGELEQDLEKTDRQPDSPTKLSRMGKMRVQLSVNRHKMEELNKAREKAAGEEQASGICRLVCDTVYAGTVLTIGRAFYRFEREIHPCRAILAEGEIHFY